MTAPVVAAPARLRIHALDGIRGLSALYVLLFHSLHLELDADEGSLSPPMQAVRAIFGYGHFAVAVFIVLSGFSLMLPLAQRGSFELLRGFRHYLLRRSRRVLPAYYGALVFSIAAILLSSILVDNSEVRANALSPGSLWSHVFLVHNWNLDWVFRINGPMWSVATEWQIYFLFPLVLLPLARRLGPSATVAIVWAAALTLHFALPDDRNLAWAAPWFVGSFAIGMWGASVAFDPDHRDAPVAQAPWAAITVSCFVGLVIILAIWDEQWSLPVLDLLVSIGSIAGILTCVRIHMRRDELDAPPPPRAYAALDSRPVTWLGAISYSTYLLQHPLLRLTEQVLNRTGLGFEGAHWVQLFVGTPLILATSWLFAEFFELPFTTGSHLLRRRDARR